MQRRTLALRICMACRRQYGTRFWPWAGEPVTRTHGLCSPCFDIQMEAAPHRADATPLTSAS